MRLITHKRGFSINFAGTRYTQNGSLIVGLQEGSSRLVLAGAFGDWHDEWAFAWTSKYCKPVTYRKVLAV